MSNILPLGTLRRTLFRIPVAAYGILGMWSSWGPLPGGWYGTHTFSGWGDVEDSWGKWFPHLGHCMCLHSSGLKNDEKHPRPWWRYQMETFSVSMALCAGNSPVTGVNSPHKGQRRGALMFSLICAWPNGWVNNGKAGDLRRHRAHYGVTVMVTKMEDCHVAAIVGVTIMVPSRNVLVTAIHLKIGYPKMKSKGHRSSEELWWLNQMIGCCNISTGNGHQVTSLIYMWFIIFHFDYPQWIYHKIIPLHAIIHTETTLKLM